MLSYIRDCDQNMKVFITDSGTKQTLAAVRGLGMKNIKIIVGGTASKYHLTYFSRYITKSIRYPDPKDEIRFIKAIRSITKRHIPSVIIPVTFRSNYLLSKYLDKLDKKLIPITPFPRYRIAAYKDETMKYCVENGFPVPLTYYPRTLKDLKQIAKEASFPLVIKSPVESGSVNYVNNEEELIQTYNQLKHFFKNIYGKTEPIVQEFLLGDGYGFFALFNYGEPRAVFCHHRLHEYPITGGPSTKAESYYNGRMISIGIKLLKSLNWHGVAMVEFKRSYKTGKFKIVEINPKFWGSLDLAIKSGINFPYLLTKMVTDGDVERKCNYNLNISHRWIFEELFYLKASHNKLVGIQEYIKDIGNRNCYSDFNIKDPKPFIILTGSAIRTLLKRMKFSKYPHGKPEL